MNWFRTASEPKAKTCRTGSKLCFRAGFELFALVPNYKATGTSRDQKHLVTESFTLVISAFRTISSVKLQFPYSIYSVCTFRTGSCKGMCEEIQVSFWGWELDSQKLSLRMILMGPSFTGLGSNPRIFHVPSTYPPRTVHAPSTHLLFL